MSSQKAFAPKNVTFMEELQASFGCERSLVEKAVQRAIEKNHVAGSIVAWNLREKEAIESELEKIVPIVPAAPQESSDTAPASGGIVSSAPSPAAPLVAYLQKSAEASQKIAPIVRQQFVASAAQFFRNEADRANAEIYEALATDFSALPEGEAIDCDFFTVQEDPLSLPGN